MPGVWLEREVVVSDEEICVTHTFIYKDFEGTLYYTNILVSEIGIDFGGLSYELLVTGSMYQRPKRMTLTEWKHVVRYIRNFAYALEITSEEAPNQFAE